MTTAFKFIDFDSSGGLNPAEFQAVMRILRLQWTSGKGADASIRSDGRISSDGRVSSKYFRT
jgi:hypothetical protein